MILHSCSLQLFWAAMRIDSRQFEGKPLNTVSNYYCSWNCEVPRIFDIGLCTFECLMSSTKYPNNMKYFIQLSQAVIITDIFHRNFVWRCTLYYTQNNNCCSHCLIISMMVCLEYDWVRIRLAYCVDKKIKSIVNSIDNYHASNQTLQVGLRKHWSHQSHGKNDVTSHYI